jgi:DNA-binding response OmpR family regulator
MKRILVVDDDPGIRLLYEEELAEEGYDVFSSDGENGLVQLVVARRPDLILLDLNLRSRSGLNLLQDIRNAFHGVPVIVTSAYPAFQTDLKSVGADAYVTKTSDLTGLKKEIQKCLSCPRPVEEKGIIPRKRQPAVPSGMSSHK